MLSRVILFAILLYPHLCISDVGNSTDPKTNVKFSSNNKSFNARNLKFQDKYTIPNIEKLSPIIPEHDKHGIHSVLLQTIDINKGKNNKRRIGRLTCGPAVDLYWNDDLKESIESLFFEGVVPRFNDYGYHFTLKGSRFAKESLKLTANLTQFKINICKKNKDGRDTKTSAYVKVKWQLKDPKNEKILFEEETAGSTLNVYRDSVADSIGIAMYLAVSIAAENLLADKKFYKNITFDESKKIKQRMRTIAKLPFKLGAGQNQFKKVVEELNKNAIVIITPFGHGSGVIVTSEGHALTNHHVVGFYEQVRVKTFDNFEYKASVLRVDRERDIALLKINQHDLYQTGVSIANKLPASGDDLYIIGTPLDVRLGNSITKGIISAKRKIENLSFYQTDAAINPGNSGGPVFNNHGELIAIAVSGLVSRTGASLNINYLIPIDDALKKLKLKLPEVDNRKVVKREQKVNNKPIKPTTQEQTNNAILSKLQALHLWLDERIF